VAVHIKPSIRRSHNIIGRGDLEPSVRRPKRRSKEEEAQELERLLFIDDDRELQ